MIYFYFIFCARQNNNNSDDEKSHLIAAAVNKKAIHSPLESGKWTHINYWLVISCHLHRFWCVLKRQRRKRENQSEWERKKRPLMFLSSSKNSAGGNARNIWPMSILYCIHNFSPVDSNVPSNTTIIIEHRSKICSPIAEFCCDVTSQVGKLQQTKR